MIFLEFFEDSVGAFESSSDDVCGDRFVIDDVSELLDAIIDIARVRLAVLGRDRTVDTCKIFGIEDSECTVFEQDLERVESQPLRNRDIDVECFLCYFFSFSFDGMVAQCLDIVCAVCDLDKNHSEIFAHRQKCFFECFELFFFGREVLDVCGELDFADFDQGGAERGDLIPKLFAEVVDADIRDVLGDIMEQRGLDRDEIRTYLE